MEKPVEPLVANKNRQTKEKTFKDSFVFLFVIFIVTDQVSKYFAHNTYRNYNFAFSLPLNFYIMHAIYLIGIVLIFFYLIKHFNNLPFKALVAWTLILSGAVSNVGERMVLGYARDWIRIGSGIFNLADGYIIFGILLLLIIDTKKKQEARIMN